MQLKSLQSSKTKMIFVLFSAAFFTVVTTSVLAAERSSKLMYRLGYCEALTVDFIASLVTKEAQNLLGMAMGVRPERKEVRFDLFTSRNPIERQRLSVGDSDRLLKSNFNPDWPIRIVIHGFLGQSATCSNAAIKDAYLERGNFNVILVDWSDYAFDINYLRVIMEVFEISKKLNDFSRFLHDVTGVRYEDMYLIGHSYGSHLAGVAGKLLKPHNYGVIYALDAGGPFHSGMNDDWRLASSDALYVESIQTDTMAFGMDSGKIGHASFFPNWGLGQPHCPNITSMEPDFVCDHYSAPYYFAESIRRDKAFGAIKCKNFNSIKQHDCGCGSKMCLARAYMGGEPAVPKRGIFYLSTQKESPFGMGPICRMKKPLNPTSMTLKDSWR